VKNWQKYLTELVGTTALLCAVIGSGIMAENLSAGNNGVALIANTLATVFALYVLIEALGPLSGAHFNPAVSMVMAYRRELPLELLLGYVAAQLIGAMLGAWLAHAMFDLEILQWSTKVRSANGQLLAELVATAGLVFVILRAPAAKASTMVACYVGAAYWFTASTFFANPAAVLGRMMSNTFAGIHPGSAFQFVSAELIGAFLGLTLFQLLRSESL
jgi:glycerol uptake facilitator-like aquaporin